MFNDKIYINKDTISFYASTNEKYLEGEVKGVIIELPGLGGSSCLGGLIDFADYEREHAVEYAKKGIVLAYMYPGPWSWGNKGAIRMTDAVIDAIAEKYSLEENFPLVISGGSMGGLGSLMYAIEGKHKISAVAAACPVVDALYSMKVHPEFPRALISAVASYDMPFEEALKSVSPSYRVKELPLLKYYICSDGEDEVIPVEQIESMVSNMKSLGLDVTYRPQPGLGHGGFTGEVWNELHKFMEDCILTC
ncbi:MAG: hypothetical protein E7564_02800 [Ruminococcaceae bacterium]|nr:hypothetical protein [Oscillospiraceae bacterium]